MRLRNRQVFRIKGQAALGGPAIEKDQVTYQSGNGLEDLEEHDLPLCQAGCVIHTTDEIKAIDRNTGQLLCEQHSHMECSTCHQKIGPVTQVTVFGSVYCREHGHRLVALWVVGGLAVLVLLFLITKDCSGIYL